MNYIAINFNTFSQVIEGIKKLRDVGYLFTNNRYNDPNYKRMTDLHEIVSQLHTPAAITLGETTCKMEWCIYEKVAFREDRNFGVMTVDEFLAFNKDFVPESYKRIYER